MKINSLDNSGYVLSVDRVKMVKKTKSDQSDKVDISERAKQLAKGEGLTPERLKLIRQRIAENYYDQDDVLNEVAKRIIDTENLKQPPESGTDSGKV